MSRQIILDLVTHDPKSDEYVLYLVEDGPWPTEAGEWRRCLRRIRRRVLGAVDAVVLERFAALYPESRGKPIRIQVDSPSGLPGALRDLIERLEAYVHDENPSANSLRTSAALSTLRIVTGHALVRFGSTSSPDDR